VATYKRHSTLFKLTLVHAYLNGEGSMKRGKMLLNACRCSSTRCTTASGYTRRLAISVPSNSKPNYGTYPDHRIDSDQIVIVDTLA
jgi:hypothetical protein